MLSPVDAPADAETPTTRLPKVPKPAAEAASAATPYAPKLTAPKNPPIAADVSSPLSETLPPDTYIQSGCGEKVNASPVHFQLASTYCRQRF